MLIVEPLTSRKENKTLIQTFKAEKSGKGLETFLRENAWNEDLSGTTKVYLVKDKTTSEIVSFFALSAGLLYKELGSEDYQLSESEEEIVNICITAILEKDDSITPDNVLSWYEDDNTVDKEKVLRVIEKRSKIKLAARDDPENSENIVNIKHVSETFPGIVITHFCKNVNYSFDEELLFPIGFFIFWEIIIDKVLDIASQLGCQYLYLFAADNTEQMPGQPSVTYVWDYENDESSEDAVPVYKLVEYYKNELKFDEVQDVIVLKPYYDFQCFSLIQKIDSLKEHREAAWIQHSDVGD